MKAFNTIKIGNTDDKIEARLNSLASIVNTNEQTNQIEHENLKDKMTETQSAFNTLRTQVETSTTNFRNELEVFENDTDLKVENIQATANQAVQTADNVSLELETTNAQVNSIINNITNPVLTKETINSNNAIINELKTKHLTTDILTINDSLGNITTNDITMNGSLYKGNLELTPLDMFTSDLPAVFKITNFNVGRATLTLYRNREGTTYPISTIAIESSGFNAGNATLDDKYRTFRAQYTYNNALYLELSGPEWRLETDRYYYSIQFMNTLPSVKIVVQNGLDFDAYKAETSYIIESGTCNWFFGNHTEDYITRINGAMRADTFVIDTISGDSISSHNTLVTEYAKIVDSVFNQESITLKSGDYKEVIKPSNPDEKNEGFTFIHEEINPETEEVTDKVLATVNKDGLKAGKATIDNITAKNASIENLTITGEEITWTDGNTYSPVLADEDLSWVRSSNPWA